MKLDCVGTASGPSFGVVIYWRFLSNCHGAVDPLERGLATQHFQRLKQRRGDFTAAHRDANRLEHLAGFDFQPLRARSQRRVQARRD